MSMRKLLVGTVCLSALFAGTLQRGERDRAMSHLHATRKQFLDAIEGLSEAQWNYKPDAKTWSIAEVAEHIAISEDTIGGMVEKLAASPARQVDLKANDEAVMKGMVDRSKKFQAPEMLQPARRWNNRKELAAHFKASRDKLIAYVDKTPDDLRSRTAPHPVFKELDGYQWILVISTHCERHTMQILEVKSNPNFPKN
jgi:uncharacterized damage-inducible protein DinB